MKLVVSIVQSDDAARLIEALNKRGFRATVINTEGGFLRQGNATILIGIADEEVDSILALVKEICHTRTQRITPVPPLTGETRAPDTDTVDIPVGGAVVFVLNVEQFERY